MHDLLCVTHTNYLYTSTPVTLSGQSESGPTNDSFCVTHTNSVYTPERDSRAGLVRLDTTTQWIHDDQKLHRVPHTHTRRLPLTLFYTTHTNCLPYTRLRSGNKEGVTT